jgi:hypothetical protein
MTLRVIPRFLLLGSLTFIQSTVLNAQNNLVGFGRMSEFQIRTSIEGMLSGDFNGDGRTDLIGYGGATVTIFYGLGLGGYDQKVFRLNHRIAGLAVGDCNRDGFSDVVVLTSNPKGLAVYLHSRDTLQLQWEKGITFPGEEVVVQDVNGDRIPDIVIWGKKDLGIQVFLGERNSTFRSPATILEEYSLEKVLFVDINGDRILDVVAHDWINGSMLFFSGIGRFRWSTPSVVGLSAELTDFSLLDADDDDNTDIAVLHKDELKIYLGDGLGSFSLALEVPLSFKATAMHVDDVNGDERPDIIVFSKTERLFATFVNTVDPADRFRQKVTYSAGADPVTFMAIKPTVRGNPSVVVFDKLEQKVTQFHDIEFSPFQTAEQAYALGLLPQGISMLDVNNDGNIDCIVTNSGSTHLSLFINRGDGTFYGQIPIPVGRGGETADALRKNDSTFLFVITHPSDAQISLTEMQYPSFHSNRVVFSTNTSPKVVSASVTQQPGKVRALLSTWDETMGRVSLSELRLGNSQSEELPVHPSGWNAIAADVADINNDGLLDFIYLTVDSRLKKGSVKLTLSGGTNGARTSTLFAVPDTGIRRGAVICLDLNDDGRKDIAVHYQSDDGYLVLAYAKSDSSFASPSETFSQVILKNRNEIQLADIDGDGRKDIVILNNLTRTLQVFIAADGGGFLKPRRIMSVPTGGAFAVGDFNKDGIPDIAVVFSDPGVFRVILGKE